jgi:hypothetical protein
MPRRLLMPRRRWQRAPMPVPAQRRQPGICPRRCRLRAVGVAGLGWRLRHRAAAPEEPCAGAAAVGRIGGWRAGPDADRPLRPSRSSAQYRLGVCVATRRSPAPPPSGRTLGRRPTTAGGNYHSEWYPFRTGPRRPTRTPGAALPDLGDEARQRGTRGGLDPVGARDDRWRRGPPPEVRRRRAAEGGATPPIRIAPTSHLHPTGAVHAAPAKEQREAALEVGKVHPGPIVHEPEGRLGCRFLGKVASLRLRQPDEVVQRDPTTETAFPGGHRTKLRLCSVASVAMFTSNRRAGEGNRTLTVSLGS